jgi:hypothetical protein
MVHKHDNEEEEEEVIPPFSSNSIIDYFDEIEKRIEEQSKRRGRVKKEWKASINELITHVNRVCKHKIYPLQ